MTEGITCFNCNSKNITIDQWYDSKLRTNVWKKKCRDCGFETTQYKPF